MRLFLLGWAASATVMLLLWLVQRRTKDASIVDVGWSANIGLLAVFYSIAGTAPAPRRAWLAVLAGIWSFRLSYYIAARIRRARGEDPRYQKLREQCADCADSLFFAVFQLNSLLSALLAIPFLVICNDPTPGLGWREWAAAAVLALSVVGESAADRQLASFRSNPSNKGRTCRQGLWRYSRHPNYFFEWLHWWTYVVMAWGAPLWGWTLMGPAVMALFLLKVTGIPATEAHAALSRPDYKEYQRTTSAFFPWFPKEDV